MPDNEPIIPKYMNLYKRIEYNGHHIDIYYDESPEVPAHGITSVHSIRSITAIARRKSSTGISNGRKYSTVTAISRTRSRNNTSL